MMESNSNVFFSLNMGGNFFFAQNIENMIWGIFAHVITPMTAYASFFHNLKSINLSTCEKTWRGNLGSLYWKMKRFEKKNRDNILFLRGGLFGKNTT